MCGPWRMGGPYACDAGHMRVAPAWPAPATSCAHAPRMIIALSSPRGQRRRARGRPTVCTGAMYHESMTPARERSQRPGHRRCRAARARIRACVRSPTGPIGLSNPKRIRAQEMRRERQARISLEWTVGASHTPQAPRLAGGHCAGGDAQCPGKDRTDPRSSSLAKVDRLAELPADCTASRQPCKTGLDSRFSPACTLARRNPGRTRRIITKVPSFLINTAQHLQSRRDHA